VEETDHGHYPLREGNYAPYNFLTIFSDGFIAVWLLLLLYLYHRWVVEKLNPAGEQEQQIRSRGSR
jgi:hypothetical protein